MEPTKNVNIVEDFVKFDWSQDDVFEMSEKKPKVINGSQYSSPMILSQDVSENCFNSQFFYEKKSTCPCKSEQCGDQHKEMSSIKQTRDIGTITDQLLTKYQELETEGNKCFGRMVAYEILKMDRNARYDKMKEIIGLFQNLNN